MKSIRINWIVCVFMSIPLSALASPMRVCHLSGDYQCDGPNWKGGDEFYYNYSENYRLETEKTTSNESVLIATYSTGYFQDADEFKKADDLIHKKALKAANDLKSVGACAVIIDDAD